MPDIKKLPLDYSGARGAIAALVSIPDKYLSENWLKKLRQYTFTIAGIENVNVLSDVLASLDSAIANGTTFSSWRDNLDISEVEDFTSARLETIFRTNIQSFYESGSYDAAQEIIDTHPYLMYTAVLDARTRPTHAARDGIIRPSDDAFWDNNLPPIDFNCRCGTIALDEDEAIARGGVASAKDIKSITSDNPLPKGWDYDKKNIGRKLNQIFKDAASDLPTDLRKEFESHIADKEKVADVWFEQNKKDLGVDE